MRGNLIAGVVTRRLQFSFCYVLAPPLISLKISMNKLNHFFQNLIDNESLVFIKMFGVNPLYFLQRRQKSVNYVNLG